MSNKEVMCMTKLTTTLKKEGLQAELDLKVKELKALDEQIRTELDATQKVKQEEKRRQLIAEIKAIENELGDEIDKDKKKWSLADKLAVVAIVVAIIVGIMTIFIPEIRQQIGLETPVATPTVVQTVPTPNSAVTTSTLILPAPLTATLSAPITNTGATGVSSP